MIRFGSKVNNNNNNCEGGGGKAVQKLAVGNRAREVLCKFWQALDEKSLSALLWLIDREILKGNECQFLIEFVSEISSHAVQLAVQLYAGNRITGTGIWKDFIRKRKKKMQGIRIKNN